VVEKAYTVQYPDETEGTWHSKLDAMRILEKTSSAFDTYVHRRKKENRPIDNAHKRKTMNDPKKLYFITHQELEKYTVEKEEFERTYALKDEVAKLVKELDPSMKANVRKKDDSANIKLENNYIEQIQKLEARNKSLETKNDALNMALLKASENVTEHMVRITRELLIDKSKAVAELNKEIQILSLKAGQLEVVEGLNKQLIEREDEMRKLLPELIKRLR
tara:strand:+ start:1694 stop:2353 length:660 start_codon:yes stop_codon:yes gene_type:complete